VRGSDEGGSDAARGSDLPKNHFPSLPARANQKAGFIPTHRYGRGSDLEVILEVIGSADRLPSTEMIVRFTKAARQGGHGEFFPSQTSIFQPESDKKKPKTWLSFGGSRRAPEAGTPLKKQEKRLVENDGDAS